MKNQKRKGKHVFLFITLFVFLFLGSVSAEQQSLGYVRTNNCIALKQSFANSTFQNVTAVTAPDKLTVYTINKNMQSLGGGLYNYTFCNVTQNGEYIVDGIGAVDGTPTTWTYSFNATPLGVNNSFIFVFIFLLIIFSIFIVGFKLENRWVMMLGSILVLMLGLFIITNGIDVVKDTTTTWAIGLIVWGCGLYFLYLSLMEVLQKFF